MASINLTGLKTIIFKSEQEAQNYAKKRVIEALKAEPPFERSVLVQQNKVIAEVDGYAYSVPMDLPSYRKYKNLSLIHGHPDSFEKGKTSPISTGDINCLLLNNNINSVRAYSSVGEHSTITRKSGFLDKIKTFFTAPVRFRIDEYKLDKKIIPDGL